MARPNELREEGVGQVGEQPRFPQAGLEPVDVFSDLPCRLEVVSEPRGGSSDQEIVTALEPLDQLVDSERPREVRAARAADDSDQRECLKKCGADRGAATPAAAERLPQEPVCAVLHEQIVE